MKIANDNTFSASFTRSVCSGGMRNKLASSGATDRRRQAGADAADRSDDDDDQQVQRQRVRHCDRVAHRDQADRSGRASAIAPAIQAVIRRDGEMTGFEAHRHAT